MRRRPPADDVPTSEQLGKLDAEHRADEREAAAEVAADGRAGYRLPPPAARRS